MKDDDLYLSNRLFGEDGHLDQLFNLFEQLQLATVETSHPSLDLLTFAETATYFAAIIKKSKVIEPSPQGEQEDSSLQPESESSLHNSLEIQKSPKQRTAKKRRTKKIELSDTVPSTSKSKNQTLIEGSSKLLNEKQTSTSSADAKSTYPHLPDLPDPPTFGSEKSWKYRIDDYFPADTFKGADVDMEWQESAFDASDNSMTAPFNVRKRFNSPSDLETKFRQLEERKEIMARTYFQPQKSVKPLSPSPMMEEVIGMIYLVDIHALTNDPVRAGELNIGIILDPAHRGKGYARWAIDKVLQHAFDVQKCHRVQAILPDHVARDRAICLFTQMRFENEGRRRRAFFSPMEQMYKDVTYMGLLDTDWVLRNSDGTRAKLFRRPAPRSVWDELLARHQREREELLNWEDRWQHLPTPRAQTPTQSDFRTIEGTGHEDDIRIVGSESSVVASGSIKNELEMDEYMDLVQEAAQNETNPSAVRSSSSEYEDESSRSVSPDGYDSAAPSSISGWETLPDTSDSDHESSTSFSSGWSEVDDDESDHE